MFPVPWEESTALEDSKVADRQDNATPDRHPLCREQVRKACCLSICHIKVPEAGTLPRDLWKSSQEPGEEPPLHSIISQEKISKSQKGWV